MVFKRGKTAMRRRQLMQYAGAGLMTTLATTVLTQGRSAVAQTGSSPLSIQYLGHTCFLFTGEGRRILVNPFRAIGCTARYRPPQVESDLVMISSRLLDEGYLEGLPGNPRVLTEPGIYEFEQMQVQGIRTDHDRIGGRRFGNNVAWRWRQGGIDILHLGGIAAPITVEQQILMGRPDLVLIPVGGGPKAYTAQEARQALQVLNPRVVIPTQYRTQAADPNACDIQPLDEFLAVMQGAGINRRTTDSLSLTRADLPADGLRVEVLSYRF